MALVRDIEWEACLLEPKRDREVERRVRRQSGRVPDSIRYYAACPWATDSIAELNLLVRTRAHLESPLSELAILVVSQDNSCRFCFAAQRILLRVQGISRRRVARLEQDLLTAELNPRERAALDFARRVSRSNPLPSLGDQKALRDAGFGEMAIKELAALVALDIFFNRLSTLPALPPAQLERISEAWYLRFARPVLARLVGTRRVDPQSLTDEERTGPFSYAVLALDGLPVASALRRALNRMWSSPILSRRCKGLVFAVVARAIGCLLAKRESPDLLRSEGMTPATIEAVLSHLASPELDPVESAIVPFARETVWYQAAQIQRRARSVQETLSPEQFSELLLVASLANMVGRLGIVVDTP